VRVSVRRWVSRAGGELRPRPERDRHLRGHGGSALLLRGAERERRQRREHRRPLRLHQPSHQLAGGRRLRLFRGGEYEEAAKGQIADESPWLPPYYAVAYVRRSGAPGRPITFKAYPGELPVLDLQSINPEYDPTSLDDGPNDAFHLWMAENIVISGFEIRHGSIAVSSSDHVWIEDNHVHDLLRNRDNNGLVMLMSAQYVYVRNNSLHDTYSRMIPDDSGGWVLNTTRDGYDAQHNGCITTMSGDIYVGYGNETSGPFELSGNDIHDCPVHLFIKNPQGEMVNEDGVNLLVKDNRFHGDGQLAIWFEASNVLFENNLFEDVSGISGLGSEEFVDEGGAYTVLNEIAARHVVFRHNVFSRTDMVAIIRGQGFLLANGIYSTAPEDKLVFHDNVVVIDDDAASTGGEMGWNQAGFVFSNSYAGQIDPPDATRSKTLSRIDSQANCFVNRHGAGLAFLKHWVNGSDSITGYDRTASQSVFGVSGSGDLFPSDTAAATHFTDPSRGDYSIRPSSPCAQIPGVGLLDPTLFVR
jgi:pectate lyase